MPVPPKPKPDCGSLPISTADTILAASNLCPIKLPHFDCSAMKLCPNGTTPSSLNCELVFARSLRRVIAKLIIEASIPHENTRLVLGAQHPTRWRSPHDDRLFPPGRIAEPIPAVA